MKVSDYIVNFLADREIEHVFGYPGGMVTHLMDSFSKVSCPQAHTNYHEQASAFCACGYAQASGRTGVAYATSGPGATNMITGICNAYFDSIPIIFITGQVNSYEMPRDETSHFYEEQPFIKVHVYPIGAITMRGRASHYGHYFYLSLEGERNPFLLPLRLRQKYTPECAD